jgi:DnaB-like helicase N terminal domain
VPTRAQSEAPPLPYSAEAERAVLGSILLSNEALARALAHVDVADFFLPQNQRIFSGMKALAMRETGIDYVTLLDELERNGDLPDGEERAYVAAIADGLPRATNVEHYCSIIREKSALRQLILLAENLREQSLEGRMPAAALLETARQRLVQADGLGSPAGVFDDFKKFMEADPMSFAIDGFIQNNAATGIAGLSGHGKTFVMLSITKALLAGPPARLWGLFPVRERAERVIYLIPECTIPPFKHRLELLGILDHVRTQRLLTRTLSKGPAPELTDPRLVRTVEGAHVFLDTIIRFIPEGSDESSASDNQHGIAKGIFALLESGARSVTFAAHAPKAFSKETTATLEGVMRGTGDLGAMLATCWAVRQIDAQENLLHITNVKPRDFEEPPQPFILRGRPAISETGDFELASPPGQTGPLADYVEAHNKGGASPETQGERRRRIDMAFHWLKQNPDLTVDELLKRYKKTDLNISRSAAGNYHKLATKLIQEAE